MQPTNHTRPPRDDQRPETRRLRTRLLLEIRLIRSTCCGAAKSHSIRVNTNSSLAKGVLARVPSLDAEPESARTAPSTASPSDSEMTPSSVQTRSPSAGSPRARRGTASLPPASASRTRMTPRGRELSGHRSDQLLLILEGHHVQHVEEQDRLALHRRRTARVLPDDRCRIAQRSPAQDARDLRAELDANESKWNRGGAGRSRGHRPTRAFSTTLPRPAAQAVSGRSRIPHRRARSLGRGLTAAPLRSRTVRYSGSPRSLPRANSHAVMLPATNRSEARRTSESEEGISPPIACQHPGRAARWPGRGAPRR